MMDEKLTHEDIDHILKHLRLLKQINKNVFCYDCMSTHDEYIYTLKESTFYNNRETVFFPTYIYCPVTDEYSENEEMMDANMKLYREARTTMIAIDNYQQFVKDPKVIEVREDELCPMCDSYHDIKVYCMVRCGTLTTIPYDVICGYCEFEDKHFTDDEMDISNLRSQIKTLEEHILENEGVHGRYL